MLVVVAAAAVWALPGVAGVTAARATKVTVTAGKPSEFRFTLSKKSVPVGSVTFAIKNLGSLPHDFKIGGKVTKLITPKGSATLTVTFKKAGSYPYQCTVPGHAAAGMKGVLKVVK